MPMLLQDLRYAVRQLRRSRRFAALVVGTLALGICATTVVYSIVDTVLLKPLPFPHPDRLVELQSLEIIGGVTHVNDTSYPNFLDWRAQNHSFQSMASYKTSGYTLAPTGDAPATRITGVMVSAGFFDTLGVAPAAGRPFRRDEEHPGNRSVVISDALWQSAFSRDPNILGRTLTLDEEAYSVIGVMPRGFVYPSNAADAQLWVTFAKDAEGPNASASQRGWNQVDVIARLRAGVNSAAAAAEMNTIQENLARHYPDEDGQTLQVRLAPAGDALVSDVRGPLRVLFAAVSLLLLIACANAAGLLLSRGTRRTAELSVRAALGAGRARLCRQLLLESLALSTCAGLTGAGLALALLKIIPPLLPADLARAHEIGMDPGVFWFALALSMLTGLVFGLLPAWRMSHQAPASVLRSAHRGMTANRSQHLLHSSLIVIETALSLLLVAGAGLLMHSFVHVLHTDPGFDPAHLLTFRVATPEGRYDDQRRIAFFQQLLARLQARPGIRAASAAFPLPLTGGDMRISFSIAGQPHAKGEEPSERAAVVAANFFSTMRISLREGRLFGPQDHRQKAAQVAIVNEAFARKYFPDGSALGQHMRSGLGGGVDSPLREIVGVVGDVKRNRLTEQGTPEYFVPLEQAPITSPPVVIRVAADPAQYEPAVRAVVQSLDPALPVYRVRPYTAELARSTAQQRFQTMLLSSFAGLALLLAAIGIYALLSQVVAQRTTELGLRLALGAPRRSILGVVLRRGLFLASAGIILGLAAATLLTRFLSAMLFGIGALDVPTFALVALLLLLVAAAASLAPAYGASQLDPVTALRRLE